MKKLLLLAACSWLASPAFAQVKAPVKWAFTSKKVNATTYEVHLTATIDAGWHLYSQTTPGGGPSPTVISFTKNPLLTVDGKAKEAGKLEQRHEDLFGVDVKQFSGKVDFVQAVMVKGAANTSVSGFVSYMSCNNTQCLPVISEKFSIALR